MVDTTRYNTGNELGSNKLEDLSDNAKNIDNFVNGGNETFPDRFGVVRKSIAGMESDHVDQINAHETEHDNQIARHESEFIAHIEGMGWTPAAGSFQTGATITARNQTLYDEVSHVFYSWGGALPKVVTAGSTPATTGGVGVGAWIDRSDANLRDEVDEIYLPIFKNDEYGSAVDNMIAGRINGIASIGHVVGHVYSTGGSLWEFNGGSTGTTRDFNLLNKAYIQDFGAIPNDITKADDNFAAIRSALLAVLFTNENDIYDAIEVQNQVHATAGEFFINGNSPLRISGQELISLGSLSGYRRGLKISGDGVNNTIFTLLSGSGSDVWFYDSTDGETNPPTWGYQFNTYEGITFRDDKWNDNPNDQRASGSKVNGWKLNSSGWEGWPEWTQCQFNSLDTINKFTGSSTDDHVRWTNVKVGSCRDHVFYIDNNQSVGHVLQGCEIDCTGDVFRILSGGWASMDGGSVILRERTINGLPSKDTTVRAFFHYDPTGASSGGQYRNQSFTFKNLTFETYDKFHRIVNCSGNSHNSMINVKFEDCSWATEAEVPSKGGLSTTPSWDRRDAFSLQGEHNAFITISRCDLNGRHEYSISNKVNSYAASWIRFNQCQVGWQINTSSISSGKSLSDRCKVTTNRGGIQAIGITWKPESQILYRNYAQDFNMIPKPANCGLQPITFEASLFAAGDIWPDTNGNLMRLYLPEGAKVWKSAILKDKWSPAAPTANYGINLKRSIDNTTVLSYDGNGLEGRAFISESLLTIPYTISSDDEYVYIALTGSASERHPAEGFCTIFYK